MPAFETAQDLLLPGERALFACTDGRYFTVNPDGSGSTGFWRLNPLRRVDRVIVFRRQMRDGQRVVELFTALHDGVVGPKAGRYEIKLVDVRLLGSTDRSWKQFVGAGQYPIRYVSRPKA